MESVSVARGRIDKGQPTVEIARRKRQGLQKHGRVEKTQGATGFRSTEQGSNKPAKPHYRVQKANRGWKHTELGYKNNHPGLRKQGVRLFSTMPLQLHRCPATPLSLPSHIVASGGGTWQEQE